MQQRFFIANLISCAPCFGHHYAHHQELRSIIQWLLPAVFRAVVFKLLVWCGAEAYVSGLHLVGISFPHINDDARSKSYQTAKDVHFSDFKVLQGINAVITKSKALSPSSFVSVGHWSEWKKMWCTGGSEEIVTLKMEALCYSETSKNFITTQIRNPNEDCHLNNNRCEKLTAQK